MRVLCLATEFPPARGYGLGRYIAEHTAALSQSGADVQVVCNNWDRGTDTYCRDGVEVANAPYPIPFRGYTWIADVLQNNVQLLGRSVRMVRDRGPYDVLHLHDWLAASAGKALRSAYGLPLLVSVHDTAIGRSGGNLDEPQRYVAEVERWICHLADRVLVNSEFMRRELVEAYDVAPQKIDLVSCGVNPSAFAPDADVGLFRTLFCQPQERLVGFVGRLAPEKGPDILLEAIPAVVSVCPHARFVFVGEGSMRPALEHRVGELGMTGHVRFVGYLQGQVLAAFYHAADLVVVPSRYEPLGMVALEAMVCGRPVIVSDTGGLKEVVEPGLTGLTVPPNLPSALASAIVQLLYNPQAAAGLAEQGRARILERFRWADVATRTLAAYERARSA